MKNYLVLIVLAIFFIPLSALVSIENTSLWYTQFIMLFSILCFGFTLVLWKFNKYIALFTVSCWVSAMFGWDGRRIICNQNPLAIIELVFVYMSFMAMYGISKFDTSQKNVIFKAIIGLVVVQGVLVTLQFFNLDPLFQHINNARIDDTVGFSGSHNQIGLFFAVTSPLVLAVCPYLMPLVIIGLWGSTTTVAWIAFVITNIGYLIVRFKKSRIVVIGVTILIICGTAVFFIKHENVRPIAIQERFDLWSNTVKQVVDGRAYLELENNGDVCVILWRKEDTRVHRKCPVTQVVPAHPLIGYGLGSFIKLSKYTQNGFIASGQMHRYAHAHNDFIEAMFETGLIGALLILLYFIDFFLRFISVYKTKEAWISFYCVLAHVICALGIFTVHTAVSGMLIIMFLGICEGEINYG